MVYVINADKTISFKDGDFTGLDYLRQYKSNYFWSLFGEIVKTILFVEKTNLSMG